MQKFLTIHNKYSTCEIALFRGETIHDIRSINSYDTSELLVFTIQDLMNKNKVAFNDLDFIAVNQGPGPFSTLRSILATVNGLHFATNIPLIGIDSLEATLSEYKKDKHHSIVILNAFNKEVFFAIEQHTAKPRTGYKKINDFLLEIKQQYPNEHFYFVGNGTTSYRKEINDILGNKAIILHNAPDICSTEHLGIIGLQQFKNNTQSTQYLLPLYLKKHPVEIF